MNCRNNLIDWLQKIQFFHKPITIVFKDTNNSQILNGLCAISYCNLGLRVLWSHHADDFRGLPQP